jgi:hypothetical protein
MATPELIWHQIHWPQPLDSGAAMAFLRRLAAESSRDPIIFETRGEAGLVTHLVAVSAPRAAALQQLLSSHLPGTSLSEASRVSSIPGTARLKVKGGEIALRTDPPEDAVRSVLGALASTKASETVVLQLVLGTGRPPRLLPSALADPHQTWLDFALTGSAKASSDAARSIRAKAAEPGFKAMFRAGALASSEGRRRALLDGLLGALRTTQSPGTLIDFIRKFDDLTTSPRRMTLTLSSPEALALLGWPLGDEPLPGMPPAHPRQLPLANPEATADRVVAETTAPGPVHRLGIGLDDALMHTVVTGPTGAGKSNLLLHLITADMRSGRGVIVIDPKAELAVDVLARIPTDRIDDVAMIDPSSDQPIGINPLHQPGRSPEVIADSILTVIRDLFPNLFGPRTADVLNASLLTLATAPGATMTWLPRLLTEESFRRRILQNVADPELISFWQQFEAMGPGLQAQYIGPVLSRLRQFLLRSSLRRMLDQSEPRFNLADLFTKHRIVLVPLNSGILGGEVARLIGSLLVAQLWGLSLARAAVPAAARRPVSVYIDEAQEFLRLGGELPDALARSRSLGVAWHLAHQYRHQLSPEVLAALDTNARNKIVFALSPKDARDLAAMAPELVADDFMALARFHFYARLFRGGEAQPWVSGRTLSPPPVTSDPKAVRRASARRYGDRVAKEDRPSTPVDDGLLGRRRRHQ